MDANSTVPALAVQWTAAQEGAVFTTDTGLALLAVEGPEAASFLQGQLSNDVLALAPGAGQWTSHNSPKGRMLATMYLYRVGDADGARYRLLLADDLAQSIARRLSMFILRAKVRLTPAGATLQLVGVGGPAGVGAVRDALGSSPPAGQNTHPDGIDVVHLPDGRQVIAFERTTEAGARVLTALAGQATRVGATVWQWLGVRSGIPMVTMATQDRFVAQTANWEAIGGVDFRKGCYTGQEIIARTQYLGRLKERTFLFTAEASPPEPGTRLFGAAFGEQASGTVVNSAAGPDERSHFLAVAHIEAVSAGPMAIGAPDGPSAIQEPLPYALPEPAEPRGRRVP